MSNKTPISLDIRNQLETIAQEYILRSANSTSPRRVLTQHFEKVFQLAFDQGKQVGLTQSGTALDIAATGVTNAPGTEPSPEGVVIGGQSL